VVQINLDADLLDAEVAFTVLDTSTLTVTDFIL
jgi:hypothetical protein